ncbi:MAG: sigma factor [Planctomycetota bacterium]
MERKPSAGFDTTHWSLILALPDRGDDAAAGRAQEALAHLCAAYWRPLYAFARYRGHNPEDARDLTQAFLTRVIETRGLGSADPERGRFRSYLLGAMKHFLANERDRARAVKRSGGHRFVGVDIGEMESRIAAHTIGPTDADRAFDRDWARETTGAALSALAAEWADRGRAHQFEALRPALTGEMSARPELAARLDMTPNAIKVAIYRLRRRYAALVRQAVTQTVADPADVEDEMRYLVDVLREK